MPLDKNKQVLTISDFTPGIHNGNFASSVSPAPFGAAQETNTYRCIALPNGGLGPLPKRGSDYTIPFPGAGTTSTIVGLHATDIRPVSGDTTYHSEDGVHVIVETDTNPHRLYWSKLSAISGNWSSATWQNTGSYPTTTDTSGDAFLTLTTTTGPPRGLTMGYCWFDTVEKVFVTIPNVATYSLFIHGIDPTVVQRVAAPEAAMAIEHQRRVLIFAGTNAPITADFNTVDAYRYSAAVAYSFPNFLDTTSSVSLTFDFLKYGRSEVGSVGSISIGELFVNGFDNGDAYTVHGDIVNPTITQFKGVQPTGRIKSRGLSTAAGLLYPSKNNGIWAWNGQNSSQKVSSQLYGNFYERTTACRGENFQGTVWGQYAVYPHNWLFDTQSGGWWKLEDPSVKDLQMFSSAVPEVLWGTLDNIITATTNSLCRFITGFPATTYSWQSHPIQVSKYGETVKVTDIEIKAIPSVPSTNQTFTVTLTNRDGTTQTETLTFNSTTAIPKRIRVPTVMRGDDIIVRIQADGLASNAAPTLHSLSLIWEPNTPTAAT